MEKSMVIWIDSSTFTYWSVAQQVWRRGQVWAPEAELASWSATDRGRYNANIVRSNLCHNARQTRTTEAG
jgi:hypothetical protein